MLAILQAKHFFKKRLLFFFCSECWQTTMHSRHDGKIFVQAVVVVQALGADARSCDPLRLYSDGSSFKKRINLSSSVAWSKSSKSPQYSFSLKKWGGSVQTPSTFLQCSFIKSLSSSLPGSVISILSNGTFIDSKIIKALCWFFLTSLLAEMPETYILITILNNPLCTVQSTEILSSDGFHTG